MKNKIFVLVLLVLGIGAFLLIKNRPSDTAAVPTVMPASGMDKFLKPHSPAVGNTMGRAMVVEWFDPACEACRAMHPIFKKIIAEYEDRVHFVMRYMPYHENSLYASAALAQAQQDGKFEAALDILFENQPQWADHVAPKPELIAEYLTKLGIPKDKLDQESAIRAHGEKVRMDQADGEAVGVRGTPSFFVNGHPVADLGEGPLRAAIEAALR